MMQRTGTVSSALIAGFCPLLAEDFELLACLHAQELDEEQIQALKQIRFPHCMLYPFSSPEDLEIQHQLGRIIDRWPKKLAAAELDLLAADYAAIYLTHGYNASPMESVWLDEENLAYQAPMFEIRKLYKKHGLEVENWRLCSDDHLINQLKFIAHLLRDSSSLPELANFMDEHLLRWLDNFAQRVAQRCDTGFYGLLALFTANYVDTIRDMLAEILHQPRPSEEEIEERIKVREQNPKRQEVPVRFVPGVAPSW